MTRNVRKCENTGLQRSSAHHRTFHYIPGLSITFHHTPSLPVHSVPYSVHSINIPVLRYHFRNHCFSPHPVSVLSSPFLSVPCFCPPFSVSICTSFLSFCSLFLPGSQLDKAVYQILLLTDILCLATSPYISISFPYISRYT